MEALTEKACSKCKVVQEAAQFCKSKQNRSGLTSWCLSCSRAKMAHIRRTNPEYLTAKHRKYMTGWTAAAFEGAWTSQGGKCANIGCGVLMLRRGWLDTSVTADHDHATKKTRGLLCRRCNRMAAKSTTPVVLRGLADYLEKHKG